MKLLNNKYVQVVISIIPAICIIFYSVFYMIDLLNVYTAIAYNNRLVEIAKRGTGLKPIGNVEVDKDTGRYTINVSGTNEVELDDIKIDEVIFTYYIGNIDTSSVLVLNNGQALNTSNFDYISDRKDTDTGVDIKFMDKEFKNISVDEGFFEVSLNKDGKYNIHFLQGDSTDKEVESLGCIKVASITDNTANLKISTSYNIFMDDLEVNYCTALESNTFYYDESNKALLKNISSDFAYNVIIGCKLPVVVVSMLGLIVMLYLIKRMNKFIILSRREPLLINIIFVIVCTSLLVISTIGLLM